MVDSVHSNVRVIERQLSHNSREPLNKACHVTPRQQLYSSFKSEMVKVGHSLSPANLKSF
jgi:hypothetical protein